MEKWAIVHYRSDIVNHYSFLSNEQFMNMLLTTNLLMCDRKIKVLNILRLTGVSFIVFYNLPMSTDDGKLN